MFANDYAFLVLHILLCITGTSLAINRPSSVKLENNQYTGIVVGIHPDIPESQELLDIIQQMMTDASGYLYNATRQRAYIEDVTIVLPETWSDSGLYETPGNATYEYSDVIVAPANPRFAPIPYTKHFEACGKQAAYIHYTDAFLTDPLTELYFGPLGRLFVHEWGHFRWGLLNEYADTVADRSGYQYHYYSPTTDTYEATRCSLGLNGLHLKLQANDHYVECNGGPSNGYEEGCVFIPVADQDPDAVSGSIMFGYTSVPEMVDFCDNDTTDSKNLHNVEAPNKLNRICGTRSSWEIMREHEDFKNDNNPPRNITDLTPTFHITRALARRVVVVMDTSGSMAADDRHHKQASAIAHYFTSVVLNGSSVGLVSFSSSVIVQSEMQWVDSDDVRNQLKEAIPQEEPDGGTCIQCGLERALHLIKDTWTPDGAVIALVTDGEETVGNLERAIDGIIDSKVVVDAIAFSNDADEKMAKLASLTGGTLYLQTDEVGSSGLYQGLSGNMKRGVRESEQRVQLESTSRFLEAGASISGNASVDETIGDRTTFYFSWSYNALPTPVILVNVTSPTGVVYNETSDEYFADISFRYVIFNIEGSAEVGTWTYSVTSQFGNGFELAVNIASYPLQNGEEPITVTSYLSSTSSTGDELIAFAEVRQGYSPVIDANVVAIVERPPEDDGTLYPPVELQLLDNGAGADLTEDDGIYSRYFTEYSSTGFYGVKIRVDNNNGAATILREVSFEAAQLVIDTNDLDNIQVPVIGGVEARLPGMPPAPLVGVPAPDFSREGAGQSAAVPELPEGYDPDVDSIPPGDIRDLMVSYTSYEEATVALEWTAPGDDLDNGKASRYEIRRADTLQELIADFESGHLVVQSEITSGVILNDPQEFGEKETATITVPLKEDEDEADDSAEQSFSYAFAIRSTDDVNLTSGVSNVVLATLENYVIPTSVPVTEEPPSELEGWAIALIVVGSLLGVALLLALLGFIVNRRKDKKSSRKEPPNNDKDNPTYTSS